ncbi:MAG: site-specific integrase [Parvibaculum sp.]|uniref:site-specific integrase n=1 Tax=Parvibaculum sp. TaxID=2024848 RepID=UPI002845ED0D|nr:site-specific integrase [Parvibaculum sp.]MDR3497840.1 site-specific integrase [Parvibaculum sp.]
MAKRREPSQTDIDRLLLGVFSDILTSGEQNRIARPQGYSPWVIEQDESDDANPGPDAEADAWKTSLEFNMLDHARDIVERRLSEINLGMPQSEEKQRILLRMALATIASANEYDAEREHGVYRPVVPPFGLNAGVPLAPIDTFVSDFAMKPFSEVYKVYAESKVAKGDWGENSAYKNPGKANLFVRIVGDIPFAQIQRTDALRFRETLERLPRLHGKSIYIGLSPHECVARADEIGSLLSDKNRKQIEFEKIKYRREEAEKFVERLDPNTINAALSMVSGVFEWEHSSGCYPGGNPFDKLRATKKEIKRRKQGKPTRQAWEPDQLEALFSSPLWMGSRSENRRHLSGKIVVEDGKFWCPLLAIFAGLRADEALTLRASDIREHEGVWYLDLQEDKERKYKTANASRLIPLHDELIRIGFIEFKEAAERAGHRRLFEEFGYRNRSGKYTDTLSKWFGIYRRDVVGQTQHLRDFHALRHTFDTFIERKLEADPVMLRRVMGHQGHTNGTTDDYFKGYEAKDLKPLIDLLEYSSARL